MKLTESKLREMVRGILAEGRLDLSLGFMNRLVSVVEDYAIDGADWHKYGHYGDEIRMKVNAESQPEKEMVEFVLDNYESTPDLPKRLSIWGIQRDFAKHKGEQINEAAIAETPLEKHVRAHVRKGYRYFKADENEKTLEEMQRAILYYFEDLVRKFLEDIDEKTKKRGG